LKHATKDISDEQEQSVKRMHYVTGHVAGNVLTLPDIFTVTDVEHIITEVCSVS